MHRDSLVRKNEISINFNNGYYFDGSGWWRNEREFYGIRIPLPNIMYFRYFSKLHCIFFERNSGMLYNELAKTGERFVSTYYTSSIGHGLTFHIKSNVSKRELYIQTTFALSYRTGVEEILLGYFPGRIEPISTTMGEYNSIGISPGIRIGFQFTKSIYIGARLKYEHFFEPNILPPGLRWENPALYNSYESLKDQLIAGFYVGIRF